MMARIVTSDETWVHHCTPGSKRASEHWKHPHSPVMKKFKVTHSAGKVMLSVFWDEQGVLLAHFQPKGQNVTAASYCDVLLKLRNAIRRTHPGLLSRGVILQHDNDRPHTALLTTDQVEQMHWE